MAGDDKNTSSDALHEGAHKTSERQDMPNGKEGNDESFPHPRPQKTNTGGSKKKGPAGGFDDTPLPQAPPGYTVKITFVRATNLPLADINTLSADPFIVAAVTTDLPQRHTNDPPLTLRTPTIRQNTNPQWDTEWIIANIPASGFRLKSRIYDEDPADHDDRLGNAHFVSGPIDENWKGVKEQGYPIKKRVGSKRAYLLRGVAVCLGKVEHMSGSLYLSVEVLGRTDDENGGRTYTIGPQYWIRHYSPLLGRILGKKEPQEAGAVSRRTGKPKPERYNFQANQMQLRGPVPEAMYHRYVEFKPFVKSMFTATGVKGYILSHALHAQHARVYNFDQKTAYEYFAEPCKKFALKFLELVHFDQGGRIFTYVLTLDALFRFTETGKEFGIDMLSKHTMHSDVAPYVAFSGEFFIRRLKHPHRKPPELGGDNTAHPAADVPGGPPSEDPPRDPAYYELVIDNDSGTYRPNAKLLPQLRDFMSIQFPGLHIVTLDSQGDADLMSQMKKEQRERKEKEGDRIVFTQASRSSSLSSSDIENLDMLEQGGTLPESHMRHQLMREAGARKDHMMGHMRTMKPHRDAAKRVEGQEAERQGADRGVQGTEEVERVARSEDPLERIKEEAARMEERSEETEHHKQGKDEHASSEPAADRTS